MKKLLLIFISIMLIMSFGGCQTQSNESKDGAQITVAVGIVPQEAFVEAVAGELVSVVTMIPPGYSPANFSPTQRRCRSFLMRQSILRCRCLQSRRTYCLR